MLIAARFDIRPMTMADISQVADIERESFPTSWPFTAYRRELANRHARYVVIVDRTAAAEPPPSRPPRRFFLPLLHRDREPEPTPERIVGYVGVWLIVDEAHIVAIAVREAFRGQGLGEALLAESVDLAIRNGCDHVTLEVRRSNSVAQALYEKYQFLRVGVRQRYYSDNGEDALIMTTPPIQSPEYEGRLAYLREQFERRWGVEE